MQAESFLLGCFLLLVTAEECKNNVLESKHGEEVTLVSDIEPLTRCYFVFTDNGGSGQCCFNEHGSDEDCETSEDYKQRNYRNCPDYDLTIVNGIDSTDTETFTCTLTIKSVNEGAAGQYNSYDANHKPLQGCQVTVSGGGGGSGTIGIIVVIVVLVALALLAIGGFFWRKKRYSAVTGNEEGHQMDSKSSIST